MSNILFKNAFAKVNQTQGPDATALRVQTSIAGKPIPVGYGKMRISSNLIFQGVFLTYPPSNPNVGGKGLAGLGSVSNSAGNNYTYSVWTMLALCEGPISANAPTIVWFNKASAGWSRAITNNSQVGVVQGYFGFTLFPGNYSQVTASIMTSVLPGYNLNYRGLAYMLSTPMYLGSSAELPNITVDVEFALSRAIGISFGADPRDIASDFLTNVHYGVGFPGARLNTNTLYSNYCRATGLVLSPFVSNQRAAADFLAELALATNSQFVWSSGALKIVPYGDTSIVANGSTYTPPAVTSYSLTDNDYVLGHGAGDQNSGDSPVSVTRRRLEDMNNSVKVQYLPAPLYDPQIVEAQDDALIKLHGIKAKGTIELSSITETAAATLCAQLMLGREQLLNTYQFTIPGCYILLDPMDIVTITDSVLGIQNLTVRILEITENEDYSLTMIAEDYLAGAANSPAYATEPNAGDHPNYNNDAGNVATPLFFEPTDELAGGLEVWVAVTGLNLSTWGGADVWVSTDGQNYVSQGRITGSARMGVTTSNVAAATRPAQGATIDTLNTMGVNLTSSQGQLTSISNTDFLALSNLIYVGGEFLSFQTATPTGTYLYNLTTLNRGAYDSSPSAHASGSPFCRIDNGIFKLPFTQDRIGTTLYVKFLSFNQYGGGQQGLADVGAFTYTIAGTALISPLPDVKNFTSSYVGNITYLDWDPVTDFRTVQYEIRKGTTWGGGQFVGTFAHPHVPAIGDDTYWIAAVAQPVAGLIVYSAIPTQLGIAGSVLGLNLLASYDEGPSGAGFPGPLNGDVYNDGTFIETVSPDLLLHFDGINGSTTFTDSSVTPRTVTAFGNAQISNTQSKFGGTSGSFNRSVASYVQIPDSPVLRPTGDFTIDCWYYPTNAGGLNTFIFWKGGFPFVLYDNGANIVFYSSSNGSTFDIANGVVIGARTQNAWQHIAVTRKGNNWKTFLNGVLGANFVSALTPYQGVTNVLVGGDTTAFGSVDGFVDEARIINKAEWTAAFSTSVPTEAYVPGQGYYTQPTTHIVNNGRLAPCLVQIIFGASGIGSTDFFHPGPPDDLDFFAHTDVFDTAANQFIDVHPEIRLSADGTNFGAWQRYQPGFYNFWKLQARINLLSLDPANVAAALTQFELIVYAQTRIDHPLINTAIVAGGVAITFAPDGNGTPPGISVPFTAGPNAGTQNPSTGVILPAAGSVPGIQVDVMNRLAGDDVIISALTLTGVTVQVKNAGAGAARNVTLQATGF